MFQCEWSPENSKAVKGNQPNLSKKQLTGKWICWNSGKNVKFSRFRYLFKSNTTQWKHQPWLTLNVQTLFGCLLQISLILCPIVLLFNNCHECLGIYCWIGSFSEIFHFSPDDYWYFAISRMHPAGIIYLEFLIGSRYRSKQVFFSIKRGKRWSAWRSALQTKTNQDPF